MSVYLNNKGRQVKGGDYIFEVTVTTGTMVLEMSLDGGQNYTPITDASWVATTTGVITLPSSMVRPAPTGNSVLQLIRIEG